MSMPKTNRRRNPSQYDSSTLAAFAVTGILLITLGVISLLSVVGGLSGTFFSYVKQVMHGLGGGLCLGISIFLIWAGLLTAFSSGRGMPKRGILLMTIVYFCVLAITNLLSKIGVSSMMDYTVYLNSNGSPPIPNADGYWNVICSAYRFCALRGEAGGALGMVLAWPMWIFMGRIIGTIVLVLIAIVCILFVSRFDVMGLLSSMRQSHDERSARKEAERQEQEQYYQLDQQRIENEKNERLFVAPSFMRRNRQPDNQATNEIPQQFQMQTPFPPYGSMLNQQPAQVQDVQYSNFAMPAPQQVMPAQETEMYDEIIIPEGRQLPWRKNKKSTKSNTAQGNQYQTSMTFTPREMGIFDDESDQAIQSEEVTPSASRKTMKRLEEIRKRKAALSMQIEEDNNAKASAMANDNPFAIPVSSSPQPYIEAEPVYTPASAVLPPSAVPDQHAAYKRQSVPSKASAQIVQKPTPIVPSVFESEIKPYTYPPLELLTVIQHKAVDTRSLDSENATKLEKTLESFSIPARVQRVTHGPAVTRFELGLVSSGINVKRIIGIADNIALDMAANGGVRIEIPIPGTNLFGIEIPNKEIQSVSLAEVLQSPEMKAEKSPLAVALGRDITGKPVICDLAKMPHLLIAGQTGSGKSVCINTIINSILFRSPPEEVRMIMIDPKVVELQCYNVVPHLLIPVVSDPHKAAGALAWAVAEMLDRYHKIQSKNARNITGYNEKLAPGEEKLPRIIIIIDELADLMLACKKEVEESIIRIAQLARAAGIHMVVATQRPTVDVITGLIKANVPSRIAFAVSSSIDSRTILDQNGAEKLLGRGDMFYAPTGSSSPLRVQGCFMSDAETERVVDYIGEHSRVDFDPNVLEALEADESAVNPLDDGGGDSDLDDRLVEAIEMVITDGQASISMLQRRMKIGYARAGRLIDDMAARGIVSKSAGSKPREVLMSREEFDSIKSTLS